MVLELIYVCVRVCTFLKKPEETSVQVERKGKEEKKKKKKENRTLCHSFISYPLLAILFIFYKRF